MPHSKPTLSSSVFWLLATLLLGINCASRPHTLLVPVAYESNDMSPTEQDSSALIRSIAVNEEVQLLLNRLALEGNIGDLKYQCLLLALKGVREAQGQEVGVRIFLDLPEADADTSYETPNFIASFTFSGTDASIPRDLIFNLKPTVLRLGAELEKTLNAGKLTFTFVPYYFFQKEEEQAKKIQFRTAELQIVLDCE